LGRQVRWEQQAPRDLPDRRAPHARKALKARRVTQEQPDPRDRKVPHVPRESKS
jgi:hypothetical protein